MPKKRTAKDIADAIARDQMEFLEAKWQRFRSGDPHAAFTEEEQAALEKMRKLEQDGEFNDARVGIFEDMSKKDVRDLYDRIDQSLPEVDDAVVPTEDL